MRLCFKMISLVVMVFLIFTAETFAAQNNAIRVNMEGYRENDKKAVILVNQNYSSFTVRRVSDNVTVFTGNFAAAIADDASGDSCRIGDFSNFTTPGDYYIQVTGLGESYNFRIGWDVFNNVFTWAMRGFYGQRCGQAVSLTHRGTTFSHPACHLNDATYAGDTGLSGNKLTTGGWHDAGDYGKYALNSNITTGQLLLMYDRYKGILEAMNLGLPYSGGAVPDVLVEIKYNLDWMLKMQHTNGGVFHKLSNGFPPNIMPQNDNDTRYIHMISSCATGGFSAVMALASRIYQPYDSAFAATCLTAAQNAWAFLQANPDIVPTGGIYEGYGLGGAYDDPDDRDERLWAAVELFNTTGGSNYNTYVAVRYQERPLINIPHRGDDWKELHPIAYMSYIQSQQATANTTVQNNMRTAFQSHVNTFRTRANSTNGYKYVLERGDYFWGSNSIGLNRAIRLLVAADIFGDTTYRDAAFETVHYMLGRNPYNKSFMTYVGEEYTSNPHHRPSIADGITPPWPGLLAGGSNEDRETGPAPAKCYYDVPENYTTNEIAINWQAAFCYVLAAMVSPLPPTPTPTMTITGTPPTPTITMTPTVTPTFMAIRVNCAGPQFTGEGALVWLADKAYSAGSWGYTIAGNTNTRANAIANTTDDTLFQTERWNSSLGYSFDIANGTYQVRMRFADTYAGTASVGARRFNVSLEGTQVLTNFDIYAEVGANAAVDKTFVVTVSDGQLNISLTAGAADSPLINAIEVTTYYPPSTPTFTMTRTYTNSPTRTRTPTISPTATFTITGTPPTATNTPTFTYTPTPVPVRINCGGPGYTDGSGNLWIADAYFSGGTVGTTADNIAGTTDDTLYRSERYGNSSYSVPVTNGTYQVTLKFVEMYYTASGSRSFNVSIEGTQVLTGLDVYAVAGHDAAYDRVFTVMVSDGVMNINFMTVTDNAQICAIQILPVAPTPTPTSTQTPVLTPTRTSTRTSTPTHTFTLTGTRSHTPSATPTVTLTHTPVQTHTFTSTATMTHTEVIVPSATFTRTVTPGDTATFTRTATMTATRSATQTATNTATHTFTATGTATRTFTGTHTHTITASPTATITLTHTVSPTITLSPTGTPPTQTVTPTVTQTGTDTATPTATPTVTSTDTPEPTETDTPTYTETVTQTQTPEDTPENTPTLTYTATEFLSPTVTATITQTPTGTPPTATYTPSITMTAVPSATDTQVPSPTMTATPEFTAVSTATRTPTQFSAPSFTATSTMTPEDEYQGALEILSKVFYPNPYKPGGEDINIELVLNGSADACIIRIFTSSFRLVIERELGPQSHGINRRNYSGAGFERLSPGVYYYVIECRDSAGGRASSGIGKMVLQR